MACNKTDQKVIIYSPDCRGNLYLGLDKDSAVTNFSVKNTESLISYIEFLCGIRNVACDPLTRVMAYRKAMQPSVKGTAYEKSFEIDSIGTARACLALRDNLKMLGWNPSMSTGLDRFDALALYEKAFDAKKYISLSERIDKLISKNADLSSGGVNTIIKTVVPVELLPSKVRALLFSLKGVEIKTLETSSAKDNDLGMLKKWIEDPEKNSFDPKGDGSLEIWEFPDQVDSLDYLTAVKGDEFDVWMDKDSSMMDGWLRHAGLAGCGSSSTDEGISEILQFFRISMAVICDPTNPKTLLGFLNNTACTVDNHYDLAWSLLSNGGIKDWDSLFGGLVADTAGTVDKSNVKTFLEDIKLGLEASLKKASLPQRQAQIMSIIPMFEAVLVLLDEVAGVRVSLQAIRQWSTAVHTTVEREVSAAEIGSRFFVENADAILAPSERTIWTDAWNYSQRPRMTDNISDKELELLKECGCSYIDTDKTTGAVVEKDRERRFFSSLDMRVLNMTEDKFILVDLVRTGDKQRPVNPLLVRLRSYKEFKDGDVNPLIKSPKLGDSLTSANVKVSSVAPAVGNDLVQNADGMVRFTPPESIIWPDYESPSSLETLIQTPLEYVLSYLLEFKKDENNFLPKLSLVKGNVAHIAIQELLCDYKVKSDADIDAHFEEAFLSAIHQKGLILLGPRFNAILASLKSAVKNAAKNLLDILNKNGLEAEDKEVLVEDTECKLLDDVKKRVKTKGYIDLLAHRVNDPDKKVVIDFKFTSHPENYISKLKDSTAIQLAIYKLLLEYNNEEVEGTAYFLMSEKDSGKMYSSDNVFVPGTFELVGSLPYANMENQIRNSYWERRDQIEKGKIELGVESSELGMEANLLQYYKDTPTAGLIPLKVVNKKEDVGGSKIVVTRKDPGYNNFNSLYKI